MVDKKVALAMKARILLHRASPFFNGNAEFYSDFLDFDGKPFFPLEENRRKWQDALAAVDAAIEHCEAQGCELFTFTDNPFNKDDYLYKEANPEYMSLLYSLRMNIAESWNKDLIWGRTYNYSSTSGDDYVLQFLSAIRTFYTDDVGYTGTGFNENWLGANYYMMERYYTDNGLPLDVDLTFDQSTKYDIVTLPSADEEAFKKWIGILQPDVQTVNIYLNREMRFYANLGITGGYWRQHTRSMPTLMYPGTDGGISTIHSSVGYTNYFWSGIGVQKYVHPASKNSTWYQMVLFPYPIIRMADLYLMKAECENEVNGAQASWEWINRVRKHAGIPNVETVWSDAKLVSSSNLNKHAKVEGMREIILRERSIELAFEGARFFDVRRYKSCVEEFNRPTVGWNGSASAPDAFFQLQTKQRRRFLMRDYLWPISVSEMNRNPNLKQNPEWPGWEDGITIPFGGN